MARPIIITHARSVPKKRTDFYQARVREGARLRRSLLGADRRKSSGVRLFCDDRSETKSRREATGETSNPFESEPDSNIEKGRILRIRPLSIYACARGFEPPTPWSVAKCSIQLSYAHIWSCE